MRSSNNSRGLDLKLTVVWNQTPPPHVTDRWRKESGSRPVFQTKLIASGCGSS